MFATFDIGDVSNILLSITALIAWITHNKYINTPLKYLPYYLTYAVILEVGGDLLKFTEASSNR